VVEKSVCNIQENDAFTNSAYAPRLTRNVYLKRASIKVNFAQYPLN
jgi:hypothetical protein